MQYTKKNLGSYNLHLIKTKKFKTITIKIMFSDQIKKEEITIRNVLTDLLLQSTKNYPSRRDMIIESENLYAADIFNNTRRFGNYISTSFIMQVLNDKYTEKGNFEKAIEFFSEIIFNPDVSDGEFSEDKFKIVSNNCEIAMSTIKENPSNYATTRLNEEFSKDSPISYRMIGYIDDLKKITVKKLYKYYEDMIDSNHVDIFVAGDFDNIEMTKLVKKFFKFRKIKKYKIPFSLDPLKERKRVLIKKEKNISTQSNLVIACPVGKLSEYEKNYPLVLANIILGGGVDSKLFQNVREKNSLCYTIFSSLNKLDNYITIKAGIDKENFNKTKGVIISSLEQLQKGKFNENDINVAKEIYANSIASLEEDPLQIINEYLTEQIIGFENYKERVKIMNNVKKREIVKAMKKIKIDTIFLLEGDEK